MSVEPKANKEQSDVGSQTCLGAYITYPARFFIDIF